MNAVDTFASQVGQYLNSPAWPTMVASASVTPSAPTAPVMPSASAAPVAASAKVYRYALPQGNPGNLTVAQVVAQAYGLDPTKDASQVQQLASYVAQQNGLFLSNFPIPATVTSLNLPWQPKSAGASGTQAITPKAKPSSFNFGNLLAGVAAAAAGIGQIVARHDGSNLGGFSSGGYGTYGKPDKAGMIASDIADGIPALADLAAAVTGNPLPNANPALPVGSYYPNYPTGSTPPYGYGNQQSTAPYGYGTQQSTPPYGYGNQQSTSPYGYGTQEPTAPYSPQANGYQASAYGQQAAASGWQPPRVMSGWQPPQVAGWSEQSGSFNAQGGTNLNSIVSSVSSLASTIGGLFGHH